MGIFGKIINVGSKLAGPAVGLASSFLQRNRSRKNVAATNRANREMADLKWQRDLEMWNLQNRYNTPANQMKRFKEAGLNPNLVYGQGTPGNAQQLPQYQAPSQSFRGQRAFNPGEAMQQGLDITGKQESIKVADAQNWLTRAKTAGVWNQNEISDMQAAIARATMPYDSSTYLDQLGKKERERLLKESDLAAKLAEYKARLVQKNINPNDDQYLRIGLKILEALGVPIDNWLGN